MGNALRFFVFYLSAQLLLFGCLPVCGGSLCAAPDVCKKKSLFWAAVSGGVFCLWGWQWCFLLPTGLDILSTSKDGGSFAAERVSAVSMDLEGLLYSPYGCGMTLLVLYCLLLSLKRKGSRFLSAVLLAVLCCPVIWLVLNGFLYARAKILIPLCRFWCWSLRKRRRQSLWGDKG